MSTRFIDTREQAALIRKVLTETFPSTKFSVRLSRYAGGSSIRVEWTDGPNSEQVSAITKRFEGGGFDSQQDLAYPVSTYWAGEAVNFSAKYVFLRRNMTTENLKRLALRNAAKIGVDPDTLRFYEHGGFARFSHDDPNTDRWLSQQISRYSFETPSTSATLAKLGTYRHVPAYVQDSQA